MAEWENEDKEFNLISCNYHRNRSHLSFSKRDNQKVVIIAIPVNNALDVVVRRTAVWLVTWVMTVGSVEELTVVWLAVVSEVPKPLTGWLMWLFESVWADIDVLWVIWVVT